MITQKQITIGAKFHVSKWRDNLTVVVVEIERNRVYYHSYPNGTDEGIFVDSMCGFVDWLNRLCFSLKTA